MNSQELATLLKTLTPTQLDFVQARLSLQSDSEAAKAINVHPSTVSKWPNLEDVRMCITLAKMDGILLGQEKLRRLIPKAIDALEDEIEARRGSRKRLDAIVEVLNRTIGKPTDKQEVSGPGGGAQNVRVIVEWIDGDTDQAAPPA